MPSLLQAILPELMQQDGWEDTRNSARSTGFLLQKEAGGAWESVTSVVVDGFLKGLNATGAPVCPPCTNMPSITNHALTQIMFQREMAFEGYVKKDKAVFWVVVCLGMGGWGHLCYIHSVVCIDRLPVCG